MEALLYSRGRWAPCKLKVFLSAEVYIIIHSWSIMSRVGMSTLLVITFKIFFRISTMLLN